MELNVEDNWNGPSGYGVMMNEIYQLRHAHPIMCTTRESSHRSYLFESVGNFYIWNELERVLLYIQTPTAETDVLREIREDGIQGLSMQAIQPVKHLHVF